MNTRLLAGCVATLALSAAVLSGAGKSEVADAMMQGNKVALRTLLQRKVNVNLPQPDGATALHWAVYRDDIEAADLLIRAGATVDVANREGMTPLAMGACTATSRWSTSCSRPAPTRNGSGRTARPC
jgi:hypothetical protein